MSDGPNEVRIPLHAPNYAMLQETEKLHLENKATVNLEYWHSARKGWVYFFWNISKL